MRFAHIADTHIRNLKYHKEYRAVFSDLYESLKENKIDFIICDHHKPGIDLPNAVAILNPKKIIVIIPLKNCVGLELDSN